MNHFCKTDKIRNLTSLSILIIFSLFVSACASKKERPEFPYADQLNTSEKQADAIEARAKSSGVIVPNKNEADPIVEPGFVFEMSNLEDRTLNGHFRVDFDGQLRLPYNVRINTEKMRASEVKNKMTAAYQKFFQTQSAFSVQLAKREYLVEVRGLVEKPGRFVMSGGESLESLITRAGGLKGNKDQKEYEPRYLRLEKKDKTEVAVPLLSYFKNGLLPEAFVISGGDKLIFQVDAPIGQNMNSQSFNTIQMMGEIVRPGELGYKPGADIYYYLQLAGGPTPGANLADIRIVRGAANNRVITQIDSLEEGKQPVLMAGDLILVPYEKPTKLERGVAVSSGLATILSALVIIIVLL